MRQSICADQPAVLGDLEEAPRARARRASDGASAAAPRSPPRVASSRRTMRLEPRLELVAQQAHRAAPARGRARPSRSGASHRRTARSGCGRRPWRDTARRRRRAGCGRPIRNRGRRSRCRCCTTAASRGRPRAAAAAARAARAARPCRRSRAAARVRAACTNSSPAMRATTSGSRTQRGQAPGRPACSTASPALWPRLSLTTLKRSTSM